MNDNLTHITVILDRSGSMNSIRDDIIGGFNAFLEEQKKEEGEVTLSLVQFDTKKPYETVHRFRPIGEIGELTEATYVPRGGTPLLDALGRGINELEHSINTRPPEDRPAKVIFAVVTDGMENASREFRQEEVIRMIDEKTKMADWQFVFLSADLDAVREAMGYGFRRDSSMYYQKTAGGTARAFSSLSKQSIAYRKGEKHFVGFDEEDIQEPEEKEE